MNGNLFSTIALVFRRGGLRLIGPLLMLLAGCATEPLATYSEGMPPTVMVTLDHAGVHDLRGEFRAALCPRLKPKEAPCDKVLLRFPGETFAAPVTPMAGLQQRYRIAFVPGLFAECLDGIIRPFADAIQNLDQQGFKVHFLPVSGRGTVANNADALAAAFTRLGEDPRPLIVFAYSKGLPDLLDMLVRHPDAAHQVAAVVAVAGAVNGSPIAENLDGIYSTIGASFPWSHCAAGTGAELRDLRREPRLDWWRYHSGAVSVPIFSIVAVPRPDHVSPMLAAMHDRLSEVDPRNDGQLLWYDAIAPHGSLLGYVNADHWTIAIPFKNHVPLASVLFSDDVPRSALVAAAIDVVDRTLGYSNTKAGRPWVPGKTVSKRP